MLKLISDIKSEFRTEISTNDSKFKKLIKLKDELYYTANPGGLFQPTKAETVAREKKVKQLAADVQKIEAEIEEIKANKIYENAFEWRFEFPEVLNDDGDFVGFDVVVANPPYIRQEELSEFKSFFQNSFSTYAGTADLYIYFVERGISLLKYKGEFIYILPNKWMRAGYGKQLRNFIRRYAINQILDFGDLPVFEEATTYPSILHISKNEGTENFKAVTVTTLEFIDGLEAYTKRNQNDIIINELSEEGWTLSSSKVQRLLSKIKSKGIPLVEYVKGNIFYGIKTGLNEAFVIDNSTRERLIAEDPRSEEIIKPFLAGRDIKRYIQPESDKYLILFKNGDTKKWFGVNSETEAYGMMLSRFPAIMNHLAQFTVKAKARYDKGQYWWELRACDYYDKFEKEKIILPDISLKAECLLDTTKAYCGNTAYIIPVNNKYLLAILNSAITHFFYSNLTTSIRGGYLRFIRQYLEQISIAIPNQSDEKRILLLTKKIIQNKLQDPNLDTTEMESHIDQLVYQLYGLTEEEISIVEGIS